MGMIVGQNIRLSGVRHDDIPTFIKWAEDEDMMRHLRIGPIAPDSEADLKEWIDNLHKSNTIQAFVVRPLEDDTTAGFVNLMDINWMNGSSILAIAIDSAYQGKGYGREAMEMILRFAFHELNLYRVGLGVFSYNARAMRLYESIGFVREGTIRGAVHRDGQRFDMLMYGILCDEWAQARKDVLPPPIGS